MSTEGLREIVELSPDYRFSGDGSVWTRRCHGFSVGHRGGGGIGPWRQLIPKANKISGYLQVKVFLDGKQISKLVHVLICTAFHGPRPAGLQVCFKDGDRTNVSADNLMWASKSDIMKRFHARKMEAVTS